MHRRVAAAPCLGAFCGSKGRLPLALRLPCSPGAVTVVGVGAGAHAAGAGRTDGGAQLQPGAGMLCGRGRRGVSCSARRAGASLGQVGWEMRGVCCSRTKRRHQMEQGPRWGTCPSVWWCHLSCGGGGGGELFGMLDGHAASDGEARLSVRLHSQAAPCGPFPRCQGGRGGAGAGV